jgi:hypothetical protein
MAKSRKMKSLRTITALVPHGEFGRQSEKSLFHYLKTNRKIGILHYNVSEI